MTQFIMRPIVLIVALLGTLIILSVLYSILNANNYDTGIPNISLANKLDTTMNAQQLNTMTDDQFIWQPPKLYDASLDPYLVYPEEVLPYIGNYELAKNRQCPNETPLVIVIKSSADNRDSRNAIRGTWGGTAKQRFQVPIFFLLGSVSDLKVMASIRREDQINGDIIQWAFMDSYKNLTIKSILAYSWLVTQCPGAQVVLKTDDDMYIDLEYFYHQQVSSRVEGQSMSITGHIWTGHQSRRSGPWMMPVAIHKQNDLPPYASGMILLITGDAIKPLLNAAIDLLPGPSIDDLYLTGFCANRANVTLHQLVGHGGIRKFERGDDLELTVSEIARLSHIGNYLEPIHFDIIHTIKYGRF